MDELPRKLAALRDDLVLPWDEPRRARVFAGLCQRRRRRQLLTLLAAGSVFLTFVALGGPRLRTRSPAQAEAISVTPEPIPSAAGYGPDWRSMHLGGDSAGAYALLAAGASVPDEPEALLDAADAAHLSGQTEAATDYLRAVLTRHRESPITPLAAFTLGRLLLDGLGRPAEAAEAFASVHEDAPASSLAQDAHAREVEAWSKAGRTQLAYDSARSFAERYPNSPRLRVVQLYGGLINH